MLNFKVSRKNDFSVSLVLVHLELTILPLKLALVCFSGGNYEVIVCMLHKKLISKLIFLFWFQAPTKHGIKVS